MQENLWVRYIPDFEGRGNERGGEGQARMRKNFYRQFLGLDRTLAFLREQAQTYDMRLCLPALVFAILVTHEAQAKPFPVDRTRVVMDGQFRAQTDSNLVPVLELFYQGRYGEALQLLNSLPRNGSGEKQLKRLLEATLLETSGMTQHSSERFVFFYEAGIDELMLPFVSEAAERQFTALQDFFGFDAPTPVRVEIVQTYQGFSALTGVDANILRKVGATGSCRFGKIVVLSPSALPFGYPYADTMAHELVHYFLTVIASDSLPRWFHEGVATYLERVWAGEPRGKLSAPMESLLYEAVSLSRLISPERIQGDIVEAQSPRDAFLMYAQLGAFFAFLEKRFGERVVPRLVEMASSDGNIEQAFVKVTSSSWRNLWGAFGKAIASFASNRQHARGRTWFDEPETLLKGLKEGVASEIRLGDMFYEARNIGLAIEHYTKAKALSEGKEDPILVYKLARALLDAGDAKKAMELLSSGDISPDDFLPLWREWGRALFYNQRFEEAKTYLLHFLRTNPYDKVAHEMLAETYARLGDKDRQELETRLSLMCE
jgi:tetratricopeptide (TPR) repeat protein